jgi:hypothetical protein
MRRALIFLALGAVALTATASAGAMPLEGDLQAAKAASARFHSVKQALRAG